MRIAYLPVVYLFSAALLIISWGMPALAQSRSNDSRSIKSGAKAFRKPVSDSHNDSSRTSTRSVTRLMETVDALLYEAISDRIGLPYKYSGTDDDGYDCSGFVWRVFKDAGIIFNRKSAKMLWDALPEATSEEEKKFGTLVFFEDLDHVGIVRDGYSFYHVSSSQGVVRSFFSGYWEGRITGYRRIPIPPVRVRPDR